MRRAVRGVNVACMEREIQSKRWKSLKERDNLETLVVDNSRTLKFVFKKLNKTLLYGLIWHRTGTGCRLL